MKTSELQDLVLLVDDDPVALLLTQSALEEQGLCVIKVDSGDKALEAFSAHRPDVILLDALMPGLDGFETCLHLRLAPGGEHVPVLMLTSLEDEQSVARAYEAGATDFFIKSQQWTLLAQRIRYLLRSSRMREDLVKSRAKVAKAQRIARLGHWEWDLAGHVVHPSEECCRILGVPQCTEPVKDELFWACLHPEDREVFSEKVVLGLKRGTIEQLECRVIAQPAPRIVNIEAEVEYSGTGEPVRVHGVMQDITERRQAEENIRKLSNFDMLTGLANRRQFRDQVASGIERARQDGLTVAVLLIDLDRFKQVNDTLGHNVGDMLLKKVAARLEESIKAESSLRPGSVSGVGRLGGDEFIAMLSDIASPEDAIKIGARILDELRAPLAVAGHECILGASIGVALYPRDGSDSDQLLRNADRAMYAAKEQGRSAVCDYTPALYTSTPEKFALENALHYALERGQLLLHYQPQVDVRSGNIVGAEALMRWRRNGILVAPGEFIPIAQETGLIDDMEEWAIMSACWQNRLWSETGLAPVPIAVNITTSHFQSSSLGGVVKAALADSGMESRFLELEITETVLMRDLSGAMSQLDALTSLGVSLSVDDFGTGYSSLSYLRRLPIDTLKIDRSFVSDIGISADSEAIIAAILAMARSLNLRVIAEGVETREQMEALGAQGCFIMQGFFFSRPILAADLGLLRHEIVKSGGRDEWRAGLRSKVMPLLRSAERDAVRAGVGSFAKRALSRAI